VKRVLLLLLIPLSAFAQAPLRLDEAIDLAMAQNINVQKSAIDLETASYTASHVWAEVLPSISAGAGLSYGSTLFTGDGFTIDKEGFGYSFSAGLSLALNAGLPATFKLIDLAYQEKVLTYEDSRRQIAIQVAKAFYNLLAERRNLSFLEETFALAEKQREKSRISFRSGLIGERVDVQSQLSVENARLNVSRAETAYASNLRSFLTLLGLDLDAAISLEGEIEISMIDADAEALIAEHLEKRPDIVSQRQTIARLELTEQQRSFSGRAPSLSFSLQWRGSGGQRFSDTVSGSVNLSIPIDVWIPGSKANQTIKSAGSDIEKARLDLKNTESEAKNTIRNLIANMRNSWQTIEIARLQVQIAEHTYHLTEQAFQQGAVELLTLEDARNKMTEAQQQLLTSELSYKLMMLDLAAALNTDF
jgi:outer membrane protein TolC